MEQNENLRNELESNDLDVTSVSYFDGDLLGKILNVIVAVAMTLFTLGIALPWAFCLLCDWDTRHTVINGKRLKFDGTGIQLLGNWIIWLLLIIATVGVYSLWVSIKLRQWEVKHTHFDEQLCNNNLIKN